MQDKQAFDGGPHRGYICTMYVWSWACTGKGLGCLDQIEWWRGASKDGGPRVSKKGMTGTQDKGRP